MDSVAVHQYLSRYVELPIPKAIAYDTPNRNAVGSEYLIQTRVPGQPLNKVYYDLPVHENLEIASQIAQIILNFEIVEFSRPGQLYRPKDMQSRSADIAAVGRIELGGLLHDWEDRPPIPAPTSLGDFIQDLFDGQLAEKRSFSDEAKLYWRWKRIVKQMEACGLMRDTDCQKNVLWHWQVFPESSFRQLCGQSLLVSLCATVLNFKLS